MGKFLAALSLLAMGCVTTTANAQCYSVYDRDNQLIYQSVQSPVDLGQPIADAVSKRFSAGARMVFTPTVDDCMPVDKTGKPTPLPASEPAKAKR